MPVPSLVEDMERMKSDFGPTIPKFPEPPHLPAGLQDLPAAQREYLAGFYKDLSILQQQLIRDGFYDTDNLSYAWLRLPSETLSKQRLPAVDPRKVARSVRGLRILSIVPDADAFKQVFERDMSASAAAEISGAADAFGRFSGGRILRTAEEGRQTLEDLILAGAEDQCCVVVGHSEEYGKHRRLILPNGDKILIEDLHEFAARHGRTVVVLTCYSDDFALSTEITFKEARLMCEAGLSLLVKRQNQSTQTEDVVRVMRQRMVATRRQKYALTATAVASGAGGGVYVVESRYQEPGPPDDLTPKTR